MKSLLSVPTPVIDATSHDYLAAYRDRTRSWRTDASDIPDDVIRGKAGDAILADLSRAAAAVSDRSFGRVVDSIIASRAGTFSAIPSFKAAPLMLLDYLRHEMIDGWVYKRERDGHLHPYLVTGITVTPPANKGDQPSMRLRLRADNAAAGTRDKFTSDALITIYPADVTRKKPADVLLALGLHKETAALKADHEAEVTRYLERLADTFAQQYRFTGRPFGNDTWREETDRTNRKVINDLKPSELPAFRGTSPTDLLPDDGVAPVPTLTLFSVFDLHTHGFYVANSRDLTEYTYDKTLRDKLILPDDQRELLDILTSDIDTFTGDIIEGKSSGNVILAKGEPGIGKTLTAEVYSEVIERPLYSIHSGTLGITAPDVRSNLETVFKRAKRWDVVLLLDEADVFVLTRGENIQQNAIVAEFLRTLEYFDGLLFMTTNRANEIDDAILSRCAAIIDYRVPGPEDARKVWVVLAAGHDVTLPDGLLTELVDGYGHIAPRDIKMLLRLALRVAASRGVPLSADIFRQCGMFRGLQWKGSTSV